MTDHLTIDLTVPGRELALAGLGTPMDFIAAFLIAALFILALWAAR